MLLTMTKGKKSIPSHLVIRQLEGPASIELLRKIFLQETIDVTFIALDFEYKSLCDDLITEVGISTLSTDEWRQFPSTPKNIIHSRRHITPCRFNSRPFLFGESERILRSDIPQYLKDTISMRSPTGVPRKVVLVGHHIAVELDIMQKIGINLQDPELFSIEGILNISTISRSLRLPFPRPPNLEMLLEFLEIPFRKINLHNAGNDANFTLRACLTLAATAFERMELDSSLKARITDLKSIALDPIDFDSPTLDAKRLLACKNAQRQAWLAYGRENAGKRENVIKLADDWWSEEDPLGSTLFWDGY